MFNYRFCVSVKSNLLSVHSIVIRMCKFHYIRFLQKGGYDGHDVTSFGIAEANMILRALYANSARAV